MAFPRVTALASLSAAAHLLTAAPLLLVLQSPTPASIQVPSALPVLIDAICEGDEWAAASRTPIGDGHTLLLQQDARTVYLCVPLPPDSYGSTDLYILPGDEPMPFNLHASAQVGERRKTTAGWPDWTFGNYRGWYSPPVTFSAAAVADGRPRLTFGAVAAREFAIQKSKFPSSRWRFMIEIGALGPEKTGSMRFPAAATPDAPDTWATLDHASAGSAAGPIVPETETFTIDSKALGQSRTLWMRAPAACRGQAACDLLVVLDAHALFPIGTSYADVMQLMGRMPPLVIVGVPSRTPAERVAQFTTPAGEDERARYPDSGGAPRFLQFLQDEVIPLAASRYRVTTRHVLAGHSLAGLFAVNAVAAGARFESYAAISPTLGWNRQATLNALGRQLGEPNATARRLYVSVAGGDAAGYRDAFDRLEADLSRQRPAWLRTELQRFTAHDHVSTVGPGLIAAMNWLFLTPPPSAEPTPPPRTGR